MSCKTKNLVLSITPDEYDDAVRRTPALCPLFALGDRRSGRELLAAADYDAQRSLAGMAGTWTGRAELDCIAAAFERLTS